MDVGSHVWGLSSWYRRRPLITRALDAIHRRIDNEGGTRRMMVRAMLSSVRQAVTDHGASLLELEESFGWAAEITLRLPIPVVVRLHGPWFLDGPSNGAVDDEAFRRVESERLGLLAADAVSASSRNVLEETRRTYRSPLADAEVIPYPCPLVPDHRRWTLDAADRQTILFVGRFDHHKGGTL